MTEKSKYPIADLGEHFEPDAMEDFDRREASGEFKDKSMEEIRQIYVNEEMDAVEHREEMERLAEDDAREQREEDARYGE